MSIKKLLTAAFGAVVILSFASISSLADSTGWRQDGNLWQYYTSEDTYVKHDWKNIDGQWYFFDDYGYAVTDMWMYTNGKMYHFDSKGHMETNKWVDCGEHKFYEQEEEFASKNSEYAQVLKEYRGKRDWRYVGSDGAALIGWQQINGQWYYFNDMKDGYFFDYTAYISDTSGYGKMHYGWLYEENGEVRYNFDGNGHYRKNCWYEGVANGGQTGWYYFGSDGKACRGWAKINNNWYLFYEFWGSPFMQTGVTMSYTTYDWFMLDDSGKMVSGPKWYKTNDGSWVYIKAGGYLACNEWIKSGSQMYYFNQDAKMIVNNSFFINGYEYKFDANGVCTNYKNPRLVKGWYKLDGKLYGTYVDVWTYVGPEGKIYCEEWQYINNKWFYFDYAGHAVADALYPIDGKLYDFDAEGKCLNPDGPASYGWNKVVENDETRWIYYGKDGRFVTGWQRINGNWYYFDTWNGLMYYDTTAYLDDGAYCLDKDGKLLTGWIDREGSWYYARSDGRLYEGKWLNSNGSWYYFEDGGFMLKHYSFGKVINGRVYKFDGDGKCTNPSGDGYLLYEQK